MTGNGNLNNNMMRDDDESIGSMQAYLEKTRK